jgi:hypothetical protein
MYPHHTMKAAFLSLVLAPAVVLAGGKTGGTYAVLHFIGGGPLMEGRVDPIISPGNVSAHVHTVMGASNFGMEVTGQQLRESSCTNSLIKQDLSSYWFPKLYFQDPNNGSFEPVILSYANVYYFFEASNDDIKAFPLGLKMVSGNAMTREPPNTNGTLQLVPSQGPISPTQWTCPRTSFDPPSWPVGSNGQTAGIQDPNNKGAGLGFPFEECDGYASPLRMDLHFPSCYNPAAGLDNYKENMAFPDNISWTSAGMQMFDCPPGWTHTPHIFFEAYWSTPVFKDRWTPGGDSQPFVLSNGDLTGYSSHGDFISGWDEPTLQQIIDNCDAGDSGMDKCPGLLGGITPQSPPCNITSPVNENILGVLESLPGDNPPSGWGKGTPPADPAPAPAPAAGGGGSGGDGGNYGSSDASAASSSTSASPAASSSDSSAAASSPAAAAPPPPPPSATPETPASSSAPPSTPPTATPAPPPSPSPAASSYTTMASTEDEVTVWETVTDYTTVTEYINDAEPTGASTANANNKREGAHRHMHGHGHRRARVRRAQ